MAAEPKKKPTLKTISYMTGLAVTTVSKALKDAPDIKASTKERVKLIAKEIGYRPDAAGQRLRTGKTHVISLIIDTEEELFSMSSDIITGVTKALRGGAYNLVLAPYLHDDDPMSALKLIVESRSADGVILSGIESHDQRITFLSEVGLPFITHGRSNMGVEHAFFDFDGKSFAADAVALLAKLGVDRACLISPPTQYTYSQYLQEGFQKGIDKAGLESRMIFFDHIKLSIDKITESVTEMLKGKSPPQGLVCPSASVAVGVIGGVEAAGLKVGKDIQIVAKQTPTNTLRWFGRKVYSIEEDFTATGFELANSLLALIKGAPVLDHQNLSYPEKVGFCVLCGKYDCASVADECLLKS